MFFILGTLWLFTIIGISIGTPEVLQQILITIVLVVSVISLIGSLIFFYQVRDEGKDYLYYVSRVILN